MTSSTVIPSARAAKLTAMRCRSTGRASVITSSIEGASQTLMLAVRVRALLDGRLAPSAEDVMALARPVLRHRMAVSFAARAEGITIDHIIDRLCRHVG